MYNSLGYTGSVKKGLVKRGTNKFVAIPFCSKLTNNKNQGLDDYEIQVLSSFKASCLQVHVDINVEILDILSVNDKDFSITMTM